MYFKQRRILLFLVLCSVCQASETPGQCYTNSNISLEDCNEENPAKSSNWKIIKWYNESRDFVLGKTQCVCCCQTPNKNSVDGDISVREAPSGNENKLACKMCRKTVKKIETCFIRTGCTCWVVISGLGEILKRWTLGCIGYAISECENAFQRCCRK